MLTTPEQLDPELLRIGDKVLQELQQALREICRSRELCQRFSKTMGGGQVLWFTRPDHEARHAHCLIAVVTGCRRIIEEFDDYVTGRLGLKGDKAGERCESDVRKYFENVRHNQVTTICRMLDIDLPIDELIRAKRTQMQARWPGRGRPSKSHSSARPDELAKQIHLLSMNFKQESLAFALGIDPKTLRKIQRGEPVADRTKDKVRKAIKQLTDKKDQ